MIKTETKSLNTLIKKLNSLLETSHKKTSGPDNSTNKFY